MTTRQQRRAMYRAMNKEASYLPRNPVGPGRLAKWLQRHPKLAPFYSTAFGMLSTGNRAQRPSWKAVRKMMVVLATSPKIVLPGVGHVPYVLAQYRHQRASWRSFPHQHIDANIKVAT